MRSNGQPINGKVSTVVKFKYELEGVEQTVITVNYYKDVTINGQLIPIGKHLVTFSGRAKLTFNDSITVSEMADDVER